MLYTNHQMDAILKLQGGLHIVLTIRVICFLNKIPGGRKAVPLAIVGQKRVCIILDRTLPTADYSFKILSLSDLAVDF